MTKEKMSIDLKTAHCDLIPITAAEYHHLAQRGVAIFEDYECLVNLSFSLEDEEDFDLPELYAALKTLFGESTTMYDDFKCSFGYTFLLDITKKEKSAKYTVKFTDLKGEVHFYFRKILADDEHGKFNLEALHEPFEDEFSTIEMCYFMRFFTFFLVGFWSSYQENYDEDFFRSQSYENTVYGYMEGEFFYESYEDHDDFVDAIERLKKKNLPYNEVKPNPK